MDAYCEVAVRGCNSTVNENVGKRWDDLRIPALFSDRAPRGGDRASLKPEMPQTVTAEAYFQPEK